MNIDSLKGRVIQRLDLLPTFALEQVLAFIEFLLWRNRQEDTSSISTSLEVEDKQWLNTDLANLEVYDAYEWQPGELENGIPVEVDPDQGTIIVRS